jgi:adenosylcobinamide-GDP ribazoletransferase
MIPAFLLGHSLSRLVSISHLSDLSYVRLEGKAKPVATFLSYPQLLAATVSIAPLWFLIPGEKLLPIAAALLVWRFWFNRYLQRWIGGYTGDCLGASQQVSETLIYLVLAASL